MEANKQKKYIDLSIYGKWDSAISFSPLAHTRDNSEGVSDLKWYKLKVVATNNLFKDKILIYLEQEELLNLLLVLNWKNKEIKAVRNAKTSNANKSFTLSKLSNWDILAKIDIEWKDKLNFKISNLNKIILFRIVIDILIKEISRKNNIIFTKPELLEYIDDLISVANLETEHISNDDVDNWEKETKWWFYVSYINKFNWKDFENKIQVSAEFHKYIKSNDWKLDFTKLLSTIKEKTNEKENKFLNKENIKTLKAI